MRIPQTSSSSPLHSLVLGGFLAAALLGGCDRSPSESTARECGKGAVKMAVGEVMEFTPGVPCELRPQAGARYALAFYDQQHAVAAETQQERYSPPPTRLPYTVIEGTGSASTVRIAGGVSAEPAAVEDVRMVASGPRRTATGVVDGEGPWRAGETLTLGDPICPARCTGRVTRVVDGWLVLAVEDATLGADAAHVAAMLDEAAPLFNQHALPLLRQVFTQELPVSSNSSGQLVVLVRGDVTGASGFDFSAVLPEGTATHVLQVEYDPGKGSARLLEVVTHEVAHAFQFEYAARTSPAPGYAQNAGMTRWGLEGGAQLMAIETLRRASGRAWDSNLDFRSLTAPPLELQLFRNANVGGNSVIGGYASTASFLDTQAARRIASGETREAALREVTRGAVEGWYGVTSVGPDRPGLGSRMRALFPSWNPTDAVLDWTFTAGADDVLPGNAYQDRAWLRLSAVTPADGLGWMAKREVVGGSNRTLSLDQSLGSSDWFLLRDEGAGITVRVLAQPTVKWKLLRLS